MYYNDQPIPGRIIQALEGIDIVKNDQQMAALFARYGYPIEELAAGETLAGNLQNAMDAVRLGRSEQMEATTSLKLAQRALRATFITDRRYVRALLEGRPDLQEGAGVRGKVAMRREALVEQVRFFYDALLADEALLGQVQALYDLERTVVEKHRAQVDAFAAALLAQQDRLGKARQLRRQQKEAQKALDTWMRDFIGIARQALRGQKAQLERLGIKSV